MEERIEDKQMDVLISIHNHLVDLKAMLVEIESSHSDASESLKSNLRELISNDSHLEGGSHATASREQKVIAPTDTGITPGEANAKAEPANQ
jgi:hypothetical protein